MARIEQLLFTQAALNSDSALNKLPEGHSRFRLNCRVITTDSGDDGNIENVKGNTAVSYTLPTGTNKVIGTFEEREENRLFIFIHNTSDNHSIVRYDGDTSSITEIIQSDILAFNVDNLITGIAVVEDRLYWTDGLNSQKKINIEKANFNKQAEFHLAMSYALSPSIQLSLQLFNAAGGSVFNAPNFYTTPPSTPGTIQSDLFDEIIYELERLGSTGDFVLENCGDYIKLVVNTTGHRTVAFTNNDPVNEAVNPNFPPKRSEAILRNMYNLPYTLDMINLIKKPPLDEIELASLANQITYFGISDKANPRSFDPDLKAKNFQFAYRYVWDDNEVSVLSSYSKLAPVGVLSAFEITVDAYLLKLQDDFLQNGDGLNMINFLEILVRESNDLPWSTLVQLPPHQIVNWDFRYEFDNSAVYTQIDQADAARLFDAVPIRSRALEVKDNRLFLDDAEQGIDCPCVDLGIRMDVDFIADGIGGVTGAPFKVPTFMRPAQYRFAIAYYDFADRKTTACITEEVSISTPAFGISLVDISNIIPDVPNPIRNGLIDMQFNVQGLDDIPAEATHYQILMTEQLTFADYESAIVDTVIFFLADKTTVVAFGATAEFMKVTINWDLFNDTPANADLSWIYQDGDELRWIQDGAYTYYTGDELKSEIENSPAINEYFMPIPPDMLFPSAQPTTAASVRFERPGKTSTDVVYFEIGEKYDITTYVNGIDVYRRHDGGDQNQARVVALTYRNDGGGFLELLGFPLGVNASEWAVGNEIFINGGAAFTFQGYHTITASTATTITTSTAYAGALVNVIMEVNQYAKTTISEGDMYRRKRNMIDSVTPSVPKEMLAYSARWEDNVPYDAWGQGRLNVFVTDLGKQERGYSIRFSNTSFEDTKINGLSTFEGLNFKDLTQDFGNITKLIRVQNRMLAITESETVSLFINENLYQQTSGNPTVVVSDEVIGYTNLLTGGAGTKHPESVAEEAGHVFFFDIEKGYVVRYTNEGLFPVSNNFMRTFFRNKSDAIRNTTAKVLGGYDRFFGEYIISFEAGGGDPAETLGFSERSNLWTSFYSYTPDFIGRLDQRLITFNNGATYTHNDNSTYNNFYGAQFTTQNRVVFKGDVPEAVKYWLSMAITTNGAWAAPQIDIPATVTGGVAMSSRLLETTFKKKENALWASFKRDLNTPNAPSALEGLINGRRLRGLVIDVLLESTNTDLISLSSVDVLYEHSEKTKK